jgi:hypothetical protein
MKDNKESFGLYMGRIDKTNPIEFKKKNEFFFEYAGMIIDSSARVNQNCFIDVLGRVKNIPQRSISQTQKKEKDPLVKNQENFLIKLNNSPQVKGPKLSSINIKNIKNIKSSTKSINQEWGNSLFNNKMNLIKIEDNREKEISPLNKLTTKLSPIIPKKALKLESLDNIGQLNIRTSECKTTLSNSKHQKFPYQGEDLFKRNKAKDSFNEDNKQEEILTNRRSRSKTILMTNHSEKVKSQNKIIESSGGKIKSNQNLFKVTPFTLGDISVSQANNQNYPSRNQKLHFSTTTSKEYKTVSKLDEPLVIQENKHLIEELRKVKRKFHKREDGEQLVLKTESRDIPRRSSEAYTTTNTIGNRKSKYFQTEPELDPYINKLAKLGTLANHLPEYKMTIEKLKRSTTNIEKRKLIIEHERIELNDKLDKLIQLSPNNINGKGPPSPSRVNKILYATLKTARNSSITKTEETNLTNNRNLKTQETKKSELVKKFEKTQEHESITPKYRKFGGSKIMVIPKSLKPNQQWENEKLVNVPEIKNNVKDILNPKNKNMKKKSILEKLSQPKFSTPSTCNINKNFICREIMGDCMKLENTNLRLMNKIKSTKRKFQKNSLYVDPKAAFIIPKI